MVEEGASGLALLFPLPMQLKEVLGAATEISNGIKDVHVQLETGLGCILKFLLCILGSFFHS